MRICKLISIFILIVFGHVAQANHYSLPIDLHGDNDISLTALFDHDPTPGIMIFDGTTSSTTTYNGHAGTDFRTNYITGKEIYSAADGVVIDVGWQSASSTIGYGFRVYVYHPEYDQTTVYAHMASTTIVAVNDNVYRGDLIGLSGNTGYSTGPHLHFGIYDCEWCRDYSDQLDPFGWEPAYSDPWYVTNTYLWTTNPPSLYSTSTPPLATTTVSGNITTNTTWDSNTIYIVDGQLNVSANVTLTIPAGTIVKFYPTVGMGIWGTLDVQGTAANPVHLTSIKDDIGGDTNGDGNSTSPHRGDWGAVEVWLGGEVNFIHTKLSYTGWYFWETSVAVKNSGGEVYVENSEIKHGLKGAFENLNGSLHINNSIIEKFDESGLHVDGGEVLLEGSTVGYVNDFGFSLSGGELAVKNNNFINTYKGTALITNTDGFINENNSAGGEGKKGYFLEATPGGAVWKNDGIPFVISGNITIPANETLTIEPGVVVKGFKQYWPLNNASFTIEGKLIALGSSTNPIHFSSIHDDSVGGDTNDDADMYSPNSLDWEGILVEVGGEVEMDYVKISYAGEVIKNNGGDINITNSEITNSGCVVNYYGTMSIEDSIIENIQDCGVVLVSGDFFLDGVVFNNIEESPFFYANSGNFSIQNSIFNNSTNDYWWLGVLGGYDNEHFSFSFVDNIIANEEYAGVAVYGAGPNVWKDIGIPYIADFEIEIPTGKSVTIEPGVLVKAASGIKVAGELIVVGSSTNPVIFTSLFDDSIGGDTGGDGVSVPSVGDWSGIEVGGSGNLEIENAIVAYADNAVFQKNNSTATIKNSNLENNISGFINHSSNQGIATHNYWGAASGPYHSILNPVGIGTSVVGDVDFSSWLTSW